MLRDERILGLFRGPGVVSWGREVEWSEGTYKTGIGTCYQDCFAFEGCLRVAWGMAGGVPVMRKATYTSWVLFVFRGGHGRGKGRYGGFREGEGMEMYRTVPEQWTGLEQR